MADEPKPTSAVPDRAGTPPPTPGPAAPGSSPPPPSPATPVAAPAAGPAPAAAAQAAPAQPADVPPVVPVPVPPEEPPALGKRIRWALFGKPRDLEDRTLVHRLSLVAFLAWIGLGADGLSSSSYGPSEAFRTLGSHIYLAVGLAALTAITVFIISSAYRRIVEAFPHGGGGYLVATKLLGRKAGVISGCALLVDYMLTITVSIAAAGDALFSFLPMSVHVWKLPCEAILILMLVTLNIRGVKESIMALMPIFLLFLATHIVLIVGGIAMHSGEIPATVSAVRGGFQNGLMTLGAGGMILLFLHAYSMGAGTYTGLEAVSNGLPVMREPRVRTASHTMNYMAVSLAFTAGGLLLCYLLWHVAFVPGKTINAVLAESFAGALGLGSIFVVLTLFSEGALLVVGAQAGFIDGPRVLANMAIDSWFPRRFSALSERLTTQNGILLMGGASLLALTYTRGDVRHLVVMYSINVFLTFSLSMFGMLRSTLAERRARAHWRRRLTLFVTGFVLCATILVITVIEKFREGGWITLAVTGALVALCFLIRRHYRMVGAKLHQLYRELADIPRTHAGHPGEVDRSKPTAVVLVGGYGGLGIHTLLAAYQSFPGHFRGLVFASVGVIDSGGFKGAEAMDELKAETREALEQYVALAHGIGIPATYRTSVGTDAIEELERLCMRIVREFPHSTFFAGKIIFEREHWYQKILHNETAFAVQKRLQWAGQTMVILPARMK
jgi:amino acid transporter